MLLISIVSEGYRLLFFAKPTQVNHPSAQEHAAFVDHDTAITELLRARCIAQCFSCPTVCSPLMVVCNSRGKLHLVIDLRHVNNFHKLDKFKYEGLSQVAQMFKHDDYYISFDLKSGYHHVDINEEFWQYLGFSVGYGCSRRYFMFKVVPFGLATACYVFTILVRPLVKHWRSQGLRAIVYIDDGICAASTKTLATAACTTIVEDLHRAGFVINQEKCTLEPTQIGRWLGFIIDLQRGTFFVPDKKIAKLRHSPSLVSNSDTCSVLNLAGIVGQIISMTIAIGPVSRVRTRSMYEIINTRCTWHEQRFLTNEALEEVQFWQNQIGNLNGRSIWFPQVRQEWPILMPVIVVMEAM